VDAPNPIEVRALTKRYRSLEALRGVDLTVHPGDVVGFLGRNGAGKSTTIRILMGITRPTGGSVSMFGETLGGDLVRWRQRIGYVAQEQSFYGWMTPYRIGRFQSGFFPSWDDKEYERLLTLLDVPKNQRIGTLSGGTKVKLALALALAPRPPLLVLDEPTAGLDPVARREFLEIVRDENIKSGRTTFFSSHLVDEIELVARRVAILEDGRTHYEGSVSYLVERSRRLRVAIGPEGLPGEVQAALANAQIAVLHQEKNAGQNVIIAHATDPGAFDALPSSVQIERVPLEEIFIALVRRRR